MAARIATQKSLADDCRSGSTAAVLVTHSAGSFGLVSERIGRTSTMSEREVPLRPPPPLLLAKTLQYLEVKPDPLSPPVIGFP
jgi:hypothetical protein